MSDSVFLGDDDLAKLTGRRAKSRQIQWLRDAGVPFRVNATGHPVVTRAAVEGKQQQEPEAQPARGWTPRVIGA